MSVVITGCSRGLGLALVQHISTISSIHTIIATSRAQTPSSALSTAISASLKVHHIPLDVDDPSSITTAVSSMASLLPSGLDILINNAGVQFPESGGISSMTKLSETLHTNVIAVHNLSSALLPLLRAGSHKKIVNVTSTLGSIGMAPSFAFLDRYSYKISKAALNMLTVQYANDLAKEGFTCVAVSPGNLRTELGGEGADLSVEVGARAVWDVVVQVGERENGSFRNVKVDGWEIYDGGDVPW